MGSEESDPEVEMSSLIKQLANCNQTARNKALRLLLKTWLPSQQSLSEEDLKKLWKGLFYCVWHADNHLFQSQLIDRLSSLLLRLPLLLSFRYLACFLLTIRREWPCIDALRLDKFYLLIRRFLHYSFVLLKTQKWDLGVCVKFVDLLLENTVYANDKFRGNGVNYHVVSVFLEESKPFVSVMGKSGDKVLCNKIKGLSQQNLVPGAVTKGNGMQGRELWKKKREISDHTHRIMEILESNLTFQKQQQWRLRVTHRSKRRLREMREKK